ncbi:MAG: GTPase [Nitrososphaera sp.]
MVRNAIIMGAAGRDFHNFNVYFRGNPNYRVVAFTAAQIPYIENRTYPASLAGADRYPDGIPIFSEEKLGELIRQHQVDEVFFSYSDVSYEDVMHAASKVIAAGASFVLLGTRDTQLKSNKPVISVLATRTGAGKSTIARMVVDAARRAGLKAVIVRHPMPYGDLGKQVVQHFRSEEDFDKHHITIEEEEEYADHIERSTEVLAGVDYKKILDLAESIADVIIWDGGNNDFSFYVSDYTIVVADPFRAGDEVRYHPSEVNVRIADAIVINKVNAADESAVEKVVESCKKVNANAAIFKVSSEAAVDKPDLIRGKKVLVVEDGPSITHGRLDGGVGAFAARKLDCTLVDPRPFAAGSIKKAYQDYPWIGPVLPALGYGEQQLKDLESSINNAVAYCDAVVLGTPANLTRRMNIAKPVARVRFEGRDSGERKFSQYLDKILAEIRTKMP